MRPKIVVLTLAIAFGLLGLIAAFKGITAKQSSETGGQPATEVVGTETANDATNQAMLEGSLHSTNTVLVSEEIRAAVIQKELDTIHELQAEVDGTNNLIVISALMSKISNPEPEVRKAALDVLVTLNDTNAVPGLQLAAQNMKDPREKVAILDAIDFIKTPELTANLPPEYATNNVYVDHKPAMRSHGTNSTVHFRNRNNGPQKNRISSQPADAGSAPAGSPTEPTAPVNQTQ